MGLDTSYDNISEVLSLLQRYKLKIQQSSRKRISLSPHRKRIQKCSCGVKQQSLNLILYQTLI